MENEQQLTKLLEQVEKSSRKQVAYSRLQCVFSFVAAVCCIALLIIGIRFMPQIQELTLQIQTVLTNLNAVTSELAEVDLQSMVDNVDSLVITSQQGVEQAMEKINGINFDALNQAIEDLAEVVEPFAKFFKSFG